MPKPKPYPLYRLLELSPIVGLSVVRLKQLAASGKAGEHPKLKEWAFLKPGSRSCWLAYHVDTPIELADWA